MTEGIHHVTAIASDPQANVDFYAGVLGLRLVKRTVNFDDPGTYHLYYGDHTGAPGTLLTFSRCLGEIGSVILVSGNRTGHTLTAPVFIFSLTSQFRFADAAAVATFLFAISFVLVLATNRLTRRREVSG